MSYSAGYDEQPTGETNVLAIVSLISGVFAFLGSGGCCLPLVSFLAMFGVPLLALVAIITGILGMSAASRTGSGKGMSIAGIGLGVTGVLVGVSIWLLSMFAGVGVNVMQNM